jgi:hypothetical protein
VINTSGVFVGPGVNTAANLITAGYFQVWDGSSYWTGQSWTVHIPGGSTIGGTGYRNLTFKGGILAGVS